MCAHCIYAAGFGARKRGANLGDFVGKCAHARSELRVNVPPFANRPATEKHRAAMKPAVHCILCVCVCVWYALVCICLCSVKRRVRLCWCTKLDLPQIVCFSVCCLLSLLLWLCTRTENNMFGYIFDHTSQLSDLSDRFLPVFY